MLQLNQTAKLLLVHTMLWALPTGKVDLESWRKTHDGNSKDKKLFQCGSVACAIGWSAAVPLFRAMGFKFNAFEGAPEFNGMNSDGGWNAVRAFFTLTDSEATCLFEQSPNPEYVVASDYADIIGTAADEIELEDSVKVLRRIRRFLTARGELTKKEAKQLKKAEKLIFVDDPKCTLS